LGQKHGRLVEGTGCSEKKKRKIILPRTFPIFPGLLQHLAQQFKRLEDGSNTSLRNDRAFNHYTIQKSKMAAKF
jgi:hypothetical protein